MIYRYETPLIFCDGEVSERLARAIHFRILRDTGRRPRSLSPKGWHFDLQLHALPFTGIDDIINAITNGQTDTYAWNKQSTAPVAAGVWHSTFAEPGMPASGATDSGGTQYVNGSGGSGASANKGGFGFATISVSPQGRVGISFSAAASQPLTAVVADRLCALGPTTVTTTGSKTLTTLPALPRYTSGIGVEAWLEVTTAFTTTAGSFYLDSYTGSNNTSGTSATSSRLATAISATIKIGDMIGPFPLLPPDVGVKAIASFNVNAAPATGAVNIVLLKRLATFVPIPVAASANSRNLLSQIPALPVLTDGATLFVMWLAQNTTAPNLYGDFVSAYK